MVDGLERRPVRPCRNHVECEQRLVLAREDQPLARDREVERRVSHPVASQDEPAAGRVPKGERELAGDLRQPLLAVDRPEFRRERGVRRGLRMAGTMPQAQGELLAIVDRAVEGDGPVELSLDRGPGAARAQVEP